MGIRLNRIHILSDSFELAASIAAPDRIRDRNRVKRGRSESMAKFPRVKQQ